MKVIRVEPVTTEDSEVTLEFVSKHVYISSDTSPIVCSEQQAHKIGELLQHPHKIPDTDH